MGELAFDSAGEIKQKATAAGTYTGAQQSLTPNPTSTVAVVNSTPWRDITIGFRPKFVLLLTKNGLLQGDSRYPSGGQNIYGGVFMDGSPLKTTVNTTTIIGAEVTATGFRVRNITGAARFSSGGNYGDRVDCDVQYMDYQWIAFQ